MHHIQDAVHLILNDVPVHFFDFQGVSHIFKHGHVRPHGVGLEHHADVPALRGHKSIFPAHQLIADEHLAAGGLFKARNDAQHGGFAAARGAQEGDEFLVVENLIELLEYHHIPKGFGYVLNGYACHNAAILPLCAKSDGEVPLGELVQQQVQHDDHQQDAHRQGRSLLLAGIGPVFIQLEANGLGILGVQQGGHGKLVEAGDENQEPACRNGGEDQRHRNAPHGAQPAGPGNLGGFLQGHMDLAHGGYHRAHAHHQVLDQVRDDHDGHGVAQVDAKLARHGHNQSQGDNHRGRSGTQGNQEVRDLASLYPGALEQIGHGTGNQDADGGRQDAKDDTVLQALQDVRAGEDAGPVVGGEVPCLKQALAQVLFEGGGDNRGEGHQDHDAGKQAYQHGHGRAPLAKIHNVGPGGLARHGDVLLPGNYHVGQVQNDDGQHHQEHRQARGVIDTLGAQAHVFHNTGGYRVHLARRTDDGGNTVAAHGAHKHQQRSGNQAGGHHGQRNGEHRPQRGRSGYPGGLLQGGVHFLHGPGQGDERVGIVEGGQHPDHARQGVDVQGAHVGIHVKNGADDNIDGAHVPVQQPEPGHGAHIGRHHVGEHKQAAEEFFPIHIGAPHQPGQGEGQQRAQHHGCKGRDERIGQRAPVHFVGVQPFKGVQGKSSLREESLYHQIQNGEYLENHHEQHNAKDEYPLGVEINPAPGWPGSGRNRVAHIFTPKMEGGPPPPSREEAGRRTYASGQGVRTARCLPQRRILCAVYSMVTFSWNMVRISSRFL